MMCTCLFPCVFNDFLRHVLFVRRCPRRQQRLLLASSQTRIIIREIPDSNEVKNKHEKRTDCNSLINQEQRAYNRYSYIWLAIAISFLHSTCPDSARKFGDSYFLFQDISLASRVNSSVFNFLCMRTSWKWLSTASSQTINDCQYKYEMYNIGKKRQPVMSGKHPGDLP